MNIRLPIQVPILLCTLMLSSQQSPGISFVLEKGDDRYTSNSETLFKSLIMKLEEFPIYKHAHYLLNLPFSSQGTLVDSQWLVGSSNARPIGPFGGEYLFQIGVPEAYPKDFPDNPFGQKYECPLTGFSIPVDAYPSHRISSNILGIQLINSPKPAQSTYVVEETELIHKVATPIKRHRGTELTGKCLYFASSVITKTNGNILYKECGLPYSGDFLGSIRCVLEEGQDLNNHPVKFKMNNEVHLSDGYKLTMKWSQHDLGSPIFIRVKNTGPREEQFELVGIAIDEENGSIKATVFNEVLNTSIDAKIIQQACNATD